jgi:hypothetical protein
LSLPIPGCTFRNLIKTTAITRITRYGLIGSLTHASHSWYNSRRSCATSRSMVAASISRAAAIFSNSSRPMSPLSSKLRMRLPFFWAFTQPARRAN